MDKPKLTSFSRQKILLSTIIFLLTGVCLYVFSIKLSRITKDTSDVVYGIDFIAYYTAAQLIQSGDSSEIYVEITDDFSVVKKGKFFETARKSGFHLTPTRYVYLPLFLAPFVLLTQFSFPTAATLWLILNLLSVIAIIFLEWSFTRDLPHPLLRLMVIISLNLCSFPLLYALKLGQTSIMVCLFICLVYNFTTKDQDLLAGIFLGIITALKFSPLLFALYFLYRKRYTLVISCILTVVAILLTSIIIYGLPLHKMYWNYLSELSSLRIAAWSNQSIDALVLRLAAKTSIFHFFSMSATPLISVIRYALTFSTLGIVYLFLRRNKNVESTSLYTLEFSSIILCFLIAPTISWLHYFILATLPVILIISHCWLNHSRQLRLVVPLTVISYFMISFHPSYASLIASFGQGFFTRAVVSLPVFGTCALLFINLLLMKKAGNPS